jgi:hypothetical protein
VLGGRADRLRRWWDTARSTWVLNTWEARWWTAFGISGVFIRPLRESIPVLVFLSAYANAKGSRAEAQSAKMEMREEESETP